MDTRCHGCTAPAILRLRVVPRTATLTLFDAQPRDINSCSAHLESAKSIGTVLAVMPLTDEIVTRVAQP